MKAPTIKLEGKFYPELDKGWGCCSEELFHHTSRYYGYTESFLRNLTGRRDFSMGDYQAEKLTEEQRKLMAAILSCWPTKDTGEDVIRVVEAMLSGSETIDEDLRQKYNDHMAVIPQNSVLAYEHSCRRHELPTDVSPLEPFLAIAQRLHLPVVVNGHCVDVPLKLLAQHLDSPQPQIRENLQMAVLWLHEAGFHLHNNPELTHSDVHDHD